MTKVKKASKWEPHTGKRTCHRKWQKGIASQLEKKERKKERKKESEWEKDEKVTDKMSFREECIEGRLHQRPIL